MLWGVGNIVGMIATGWATGYVAGIAGDIIGLGSKATSIGAGVDVTKVNKNVRAALLLNKTKTFFGVKPFNCTSSHCESYMKYVIKASRGWWRWEI